MSPDSSSWPTSKRSGWLTGTEIVVVPLTSLPVTEPVPVILTVMLATVPVKPEAGMTWNVTSRVCLGQMVPR